MNETPQLTSHLPSEILHTALKAARVELISVLQNGAIEKSADKVYFADLVKTSLQLLDVRQRDFAQELGVSTPTLGRWANEKNVPPLFARKAFILLLAERLTEID
jgi:hypothetical protein